MRIAASRRRRRHRPAQKLPEAWGYRRQLVKVHVQRSFVVPVVIDPASETLAQENLSVLLQDVHGSANQMARLCQRDLVAHGRTVSGTTTALRPSTAASK